MKVLILSGSLVMGGAELAARRLAKGLAREGCEVVYVCVHPEKMTDPGIKQYLLDTGSLYGRLRRLLRYCSYPLAYRMNTKYAIQAIREVISKEKPDIINIHIIKQSFWSPDIVGFCAEYAPTIWTLQEMSSFTGRCVQAVSCTKYISGCDETCPSIHIPVVIPRTFTKKRWRHHRQVLKENPGIIAVCSSQWLARKARESLWKNHRIVVIPNGIDLEEFSPVSQDEARVKLGLPIGKILILIAAIDLKTPLKGGPIFLDALEQLDTQDISAVTMGSGKIIQRNKVDIPIYNLGYVPQAMVPFVYSAVNLLIHPSLADTLPNVIIEALACGTPSVGFNIGGVPEIIREDQTGWIVQETSSEALADRIRDIIKTKDLSNPSYRENCRQVTEEEYGSDIMAKRYLALFKCARN